MRTNTRVAVLTRLAAGIVMGISALALTPIGITAAAAQSPAGIYRAAATLSGPITVGTIQEPVSAQPIGLSTYHYVEQEYFASGTAHAFKSTATPNDGHWTIAPTTSASYRTRIIVRRPADPSHFNGTVVVEWMNVTAIETAPDWDYMNPELMRAGYAYVGVSVQALGVNGGTPLLGTTSNPSPVQGLVQKEPARYGTLHHPGDQYALDMFAQIGAAVRHQSDDVLGPLHPKHVVAVGESQSAAYMTTFADAIQPLTHTFDGIFIHSRFGGGVAVNGSFAQSLSRPGLHIRTDLSVPVFMFETQTDVVDFAYALARQPNTSHIHTWEVAGTAHADTYEVGGGAGLLGCPQPLNDGPQHNVVQAALAAFNKWVDHGTPPPTPARFKLTSLHPIKLALDSNGNVIGGVRTPAVDVPVSTLSGSGPKGASVICSLFGSAIPFSSSTLVSLYHTKANYMAKYTASLDHAIAGGYILPADRAALLAQAETVQFPS